MELFFGVVFFVSAIYVFNDARKREISNQLGWAAGTAILWIVVLPLYLFKRKKLENTVSNIDGEEQPHSKIKGYVLLFVLSFALYGVHFYRGWLPACDSSAVHDVLKNLLNNESFTDSAQQGYERINEVRHCNLTISDRIYSYTVRWYSDDKDKFLVQFGK